MSVFDVSADNLFAASLIANSSARMEQIAQRTLNVGLQKFVDKKYEEAISDLQRAVAMAPRSATALNAYDYIAKSYVAQGDNKKAIETLQKSLRLDSSRDTTYNQLGNIYYSQDKFEDALSNYEKAFRANPSTSNRYSLGQGYMAMGRYDEAIRQFELVRATESDEPYSDYAIGQAMAKQGRYDEAIDAFQRALDIQYDYYDAYAEMGYAYADKGDMEKAQEIATQLETQDPSLASTLSSYIYEKTAPAFEMAYGSTGMTATGTVYNTFPVSQGPGTQVADLSGYLAAPNSEATFAMTFVFGKQMDEGSVENVNNWSIDRQLGQYLGSGYNFGAELPTTEVIMDQRPVSVSYSAADQSATVLFKIRQNESGNGTLDPSHIRFKFAGTDVLGLAMDKKADEYIGFSGFA